jgi:hypothetical protein
MTRLTGMMFFIIEQAAGEVGVRGAQGQLEL